MYYACADLRGSQRSTQRSIEEVEKEESRSECDGGKRASPYLLRQLLARCIYHPKYSFLRKLPDKSCLALNYTWSYCK